MGAHLFMTYTDDGKIRFWHVQDGRLATIEATNEWVQVACFDLDSNIKIIDSDAFGKLACVSRDPKGDSVSIWGNEATGLEMKKEFVILFQKTTIVDINLYFASDGQHLLAVASADTVSIYCQELKKHIDDDLVWAKLTDIEWTLPEPINLVCWLHTGAILVASDKSMVVYDKWFQHEEVGSMNLEPNIFSLASRKNGRLPDYHPQLLIHYLLWGKFDLVKYIAYILYKFLKLMLENNESVTEIPMPLWQLMKEQTVLSSGSFTIVTS